MKEQPSLTIGITGASGFIGQHFLKQLNKTNYSINLYIRSPLKVDTVKVNKIFKGSLDDISTLELFVKSVDVILHLAAGTAGSWEDYKISTIRGTKNIYELGVKYSIKQFIYFSSLSVYDLNKNKIISENGAIEKQTELRSNYGRSKTLAEKLIIKLKNKYDLPTVILRPGLVYGPNFQPILMGCGFQFRNFIFCLGTKHKTIPFIHINDLIFAVSKMINNPFVNGKTYNIVSDEQPKVKEIIELYNHYSNLRKTPFFIPKAFFFINRLLEPYSKKLGKLGKLNFLFCRMQRRIYYRNSALKNDLNWLARVSFNETMKEMILFRSKK